MVGADEHQRKIHWTKWSALTEVKEKGGLGFRDLEMLNTALLAKQLWRIIAQPNRLVSRVMRAKYMKREQDWMRQASTSASYLRKSLLSARFLLINGIRKQAGDGSTIMVWQDRWIPDSRDGRVEQDRAANGDVQYVKDLIKQGQWDKELLNKIFSREMAQKIAKIPLSIYQRKDRLIWNHSRNGEYTVRSGYALAKEMEAQATKSVQSKEQTSSHNRKESL